MWSNAMDIAKADFIEGMAKGLAVLESFDTERQRLNATLAAQRAGLSRAAAVAQAAAFTLLNPHVYLDTVLLVGSIGAQQPAPLRGWFVVGASTASLLWFGLLGFGARWLAPWFARPRAWQVLDGLIALTMWVLAGLLVRHALNGM